MVGAPLGRSAVGDPKAGEAIYSRCAACHALAYDRTGPRHCGLFGRRAGTSAANWALDHQPGSPTLAHLAQWEALRSSAGLQDEAPSPVILPDYTTPQTAPVTEAELA